MKVGIFSVFYEYVVLTLLFAPNLILYLHVFGVCCVSQLSEIAVVPLLILLGLTDV
jgi:hypothetical protein